jgi:hypothetical protein
MNSLSKLVFWEVSALLAGFAGVIFWKLLTRTISLSDLLSGDEVKDGVTTTSFSAGRAQLLFFTIMVAMRYLLQVVHDPTHFPTIPESWLAVLGGSQTVYLTGKARSMLFGSK